MSGSTHSNNHDPSRQGGEDQRSAGGHHEGGGGGYGRFALMILSAAIVMYAVMYLNTYAIDHVYWSWTRFFVTMMSTAMSVIMLWFMRHMYRNRAANIVIVVGSVLLFVTGLFLVRSQATIRDVAWMEAMIPHHSIAILTSENAQISDPRVRELADSIIEAQRREIAEMKTLIEELR